MRQAHADGSSCLAMGLCVPCTNGHHEKCNDVLSIIGCACVCVENDNSPATQKGGGAGLSRGAGGRSLAI